MSMLRPIVLLAVLVATLAGCVSPPPLALPEPAPTRPTTAPVTGDASADGPTGSVVVAYPDVPASWHGLDAHDPAAVDLGALWGLPLYRYGPDGILRPGLVEDATIRGDGSVVELRLRAGEWSDGRRVAAADVVATLEALRAGPRAAELAVLEQAEAIDERTVRLRFGAPYARWEHLLAGGPGVLPAHVLAERGLDAFRTTVPVAGGWYRLEAFEPGLKARFVANTESPLGVPRIASVEVLFAPRYETALGLLADERVDVVLGHLALNPVGRAIEVVGEDRAAAPLGGTWVALEWTDRAPGPDVRRAVAEVIDVAELVDGLLGDVGEVASSPWPGVPGPWPASDRELVAVEAAALLTVLPRWHEVVGFTGRSLQRDVSLVGLDLELVARPAPEFARISGTDAAVVMRIRRDGPRPALVSFVDEPSPVIRAADAAPRAATAAIEAGFAALEQSATIRPLYRAGVAHAWGSGVDGLRPSSWPGIGFWNVGQWHVPDP